MSRQKNLKRNLLICLLAGSAVMYTLPLHAATSVVANNALPTLPMVNGQIKDGYGFVTGGSNTNIVTDGLQMNITQNDPNAVIKWGSFDVGGSATVNFKGPESGYNTLNYVNAGGSMSQIYGTINANNNGNIFIVNPAGVQIGNSAQINVGSLYVSNSKLTDDALKAVDANNINFDFNAYMKANGAHTDAALMSLGNINANNVTFEGNGRIVIDSERITNDANNATFRVNTNDAGNVVIGYDAYNEVIYNEDGTIKKDKGTYDGKDKNFTGNVFVNGTNPSEAVKGYMWVEDVEQLQAIDTNLGGNYALRNSIDATATSSWDDNDNDYINEGFKQIGTANNEFTGKFDGLDYNIFGLTINRADENNVGLFGVVDGATINNVTLVGGSITGTGSNVGAIVGRANNTTLTNVVNSAAVSGNSYVGGIVGRAYDSAIKDAINTGTINGSGDNVGGLIGNLQNSKFIEATDTTKEVEKGLIGNSYNLGDVSGNGHNVGGLVGSASNSTIGDGTNLVYNRMDVTGAYNVGGIVGNMVGSTVQNAENSGNVTATGHKDDVYKYHAGTKDNTDLKTVDVYVANVGGIAGSSSQNSAISDVENTGDVKTVTEQTNIYAAGNVGGIVGSAVDTNITNATNKENEIRGAHNVGGVAGYFGNSSDDKNAPDYTVTTGINDGGDIMATGARYNGGFVTELVRDNGSGNENFTIGNIGGVVGYLDGDNVYVTGGANRGTVHTYDEFWGTTVPDYAKAANVGGVVGKLDRRGTLTIDEMKENGQIDVTNAAVSNSYNTGDVLGYTGVGGVVGMMFNGEVAGSYNLGYIRTTRQSDTSSGGTTDIIDSLNMGGIVGDTTEETQAKVLLYDVYNKGQIGDNDFNYFGRHVGGVVGRLSGEVQKAYNTGAIYNGYNVVGGIAGWMYKGKIENAFNTGNITVYNKNKASSQVGGVVGAAANATNITINNVYNLGTIRSFKANSAGSATNSLGGILGEYNTNYSSNTKITISNAYTTGNLYVDGGNIGSIYGVVDDKYITLRNTYYIRPQVGLDFVDLHSSLNNRDNANHDVLFTQKSSYNYQFDNGITRPDTETGEINESADWRIYDGNTPILNAFLPNAEKYFDQYQNKEDLNNAGINSIQYGTAYDPLLTIIKANGTKDNLSYNWSDLGISSAAGIAVYGAGLTLDDINTSSGTGYFGGTIYADGALNLNAKVTDTNNISGNIGLGSASQIYGSSVNIDADGKVTIYGDVTATGNIDNGTTDTIDTSLAVEDAGNITITGSDVDVYGTLTSATKDTTGATVKIPGIEENAVTWEPGAINNPLAAMDDIADRFAHTTGPSAVNGDITITANGVKDENDEIIGGNVNLYYGNKQEGLITSGGDLTVTGEGDVYVDSDLDIGGNLTLEAGAGKEALLDITNIGQVQAKNGTVANTITGLNNFLNHFDEKTGNKISFSNTTDAKITVDMWNGNTLELNKFGSDFTDKLDKLNLNGKHANKITHIWVNNGEQLKNIQNADEKALGYNFALKGDINASDVENYVAIGTGSEFTGTFDGRGNRIIGLDTTKDNKGTNNNSMANAGIFSTIGEGGTVKNVNIYSGNFEGTNTAGAVAGVNNGRIENVTGFGNTVTVTDEKGNAGGIVGVNNGKGNIVTNEDGTITLEPAENEQFATGIIDVESIGSVIAEGNNAVAGGLVGTNEGALGNSYSDSAVTSTFANNQAGLGGVVGVNTENGDVQYVDSLGVTNGGTSSSSNVGGIIGVNNGNMYSGYNESIVSGSSNVGGIIGTNAGSYNETDKKWTSGTVENVVNATSVTSEATDSKNTGGLVGTNTGSVTNGRNNGTITGTNYVGGLVGDNADEHSILTNLVNDSSAEILGEQYVGGIAGSNSGTITADEENDNLVNRGSITGVQYVGGFTGENKGTITNTNNDVELFVNRDKVTADKQAQYFGGVAGINQNGGTIKDATNTADVNADGANYVGGIAGKNEGTLTGFNGNYGNVTGASNVGGIFGSATENVVIKKTSMTNSVNATIKGNSNVGGLIGSNAATITGGRNEAQELDDTGKITAEKDSYYKYQIYNNGTITVNGSGTNIGGLFGTNSGTVEAAYNTGAINASGSENVGGIAGANSGTLDQVFNTVMVADEATKPDGSKQETAITGGNNVGGLVGANSGTLSNAYNTTEVKGDSNFGTIIGDNTSVNASDVYNTWNVENSNLIGKGNAANDAYNIDSNNKNDYSELDFTDTWKIYEGNSNPLLKVFLTDVEIIANVDKINEYINKVYNGNAQAITDDDIDELIEIGAIQAPDNFTAYNNAKELINSISHTNAGQYSDWLYSQQIASSGSGDTFNPNNLGYDITLTGDIDTAKLTINLGDVTHTYGNPNTNGYNYTVEGWINADDANDYTISIGTLGKDITDDALKDNNTHTKGVGEYTWSTTANISANGTLNNYEIVTVKDGTSKVRPVTIDVTLNEVTHIYGDSFNSNDYTVGNVNWVNGDNYTTADVVLSGINDGAFTDGNGGKTNDVKADGYKWQATVSGNGVNADTINKNYEFNVIDGDSKVTPKEVTIEDILASIEYGSKGDFTVENTGNINGTVYDDNLEISYTDTSVIAGSEYALNQNGRDTADVKVNNGVYTDSISINGIKLTGDKAGNYYISSDTAKGDIRVDKAQIHIGANNEAIHVGEKPDYIGTDINGALVNGDKLNGNYHYGVKDSADEKVIGDHSIGVWIGNTFYDLSATVDWTKVDGFFSNYEVTYNPGTLTVTEQVMPDLPDNWPNNRWDYLLADNPFDRNENFRERKAEVNFVDGAMEI